jgi:hypothetical protein
VQGIQGPVGPQGFQGTQGPTGFIGSLTTFGTSGTATLSGSTLNVPDYSHTGLYLPISGGTLTGALGGTSATFSGSVTASSGFFNSDIRWKNLNNKSFDLFKLRPISYTWKKDSNKDDGKNHYGYSAQEVELVMPDAIIEDINGYKSVNYIEVLVAKIKDLEDRILLLEGKE